MISTKPNIFQQKYYKYISYIKKYYFTYLTFEQKKDIQKLELIANQINQQLNVTHVLNKDHSPTQQNLIIFKSLIAQLKKQKRKIQNQWKFNKSDYEAFNQKCQNLHINQGDIVNIINIKKINEPAQLTAINQINFPVLSYQNQQLARITTSILKSCKFAHQQNIPGDKIEGLVIKICKTYNIVGYHNFSHSFSLFLMMYQCYQLSEEFKNFISNFQIFIVFLAAISHDLNHKGLNNLYHIKKKSQLAQIYNNQSILQNMHVSTLFRILKQFPEYDIINMIKDPLLKQRAKRLLVRCILATDMSKHFTNLQIFKIKRIATEEMKIKKTESNQYLAFQKNRIQDREIVLDFMMHSCDIGNPCLQFNNYMNWSALLSIQFNQQTIKQQKNGLQVTSFLKFVDMKTFYKGQIGFSQNFVLPLWKELSFLWPSLRVFSKQTQNNLQILNKKIEQLEVSRS